MDDSLIRHSVEFSARLRRDLAPFQVRPAEPGEVAAARDLAAQLIGEGIVATDELDRVQSLTGGASLFVTEEAGALCGVLAFVLLSGEGLRAVYDEAFDACAPGAQHLARPGETIHAFYGWGVAATTKTSARRVVDGARAVMAGAVGPLPKFARPTTDAGHRLMRERLGFVDLPGSDSGLVWQAPLVAAVAA
jgi:hypothetical protein